MRHEKTQPPSQAELLDAALVRLVDAAMDGDRAGALAALLDAVAHGLAGARTAAEVWAARAKLASDVDDDQHGEQEDPDLDDELRGHPT